jgi:hypothetical protein
MRRRCTRTTKQRVQDLKPADCVGGLFNSVLRPSLRFFRQCFSFSDETCSDSDGIIRGTVSEKVTNGSKTAVMDVIGFLCVSLGSSTVQLHDSQFSRTGISEVERSIQSIMNFI